MHLAACVVAGTIASFLIGRFSEYYMSTETSPVSLLTQVATKPINQSINQLINIPDHLFSFLPSRQHLPHWFGFTSINVSADTEPFVLFSRYQEAVRLFR